MKKFKPGDVVEMTNKCKLDLCKACGLKGKHKGPFIDDGECIGCSRSHVEEFGDCIGRVVGPIDFNTCSEDYPDYDKNKIGPELDVKWSPYNLKYGYHPKYLKLVKQKKVKSK